ncbi:MAG: asparaginase [Proteobacteria bacterium]|nr:asparaginase [Pseudomonadota bacterium]
MPDVRPFLQIFTAGGTIDKGYRWQENGLDVCDPFVLDSLKLANVQFDYDVTSLLRKDSLEFTAADRDLIHKAVRDCPKPRILLTHGTDTMVETALTLTAIPGKTIVMTGAMVPGRVIESDATFNLGFAISAAMLMPSGVYIAMHGVLFDPTRTRKNRQKGLFEKVETT